jgi:hypothetical protein
MGKGRAGKPARPLPSFMTVRPRYFPPMVKA